MRSTVTAGPGAGPSLAGRGLVGLRRAYPRGACSTICSSTSSAPFVLPSTGRCSSARRSRSASRSTCSWVTSRGRPPTAFPGRSSRPGCAPTSRSTGPPGARPRTGAGRSASRPTNRPKWSLRWRCACSAWPRRRTPKRCWPSCPPSAPCPIRWTWPARRPPFEQVHADDAGLAPDGAAPGGLRWAVEATYEGSIRFSEQNLEEPAVDRADFRRAHPMDRLHPHLPGRPALQLPSTRRGGLTRRWVQECGPP